MWQDQPRLRIIGISYSYQTAATAHHQRRITPPRTPLEQELVALWQSVLEIEPIGIDDHFVALGGDSLRATQVVSRVREQLGVPLAVADLLNTPTIRTLAEQVEQTQPQLRVARPPLTRAALATPPLSLAQERMWFLHQLEPQSAAYHVHAALRLQGVLNKEALQLAFDEVTRRHGALRTTFRVQEGAPVQVIHAATPVEIAEISLQAVDASERLAEALTLAQSEAGRVFDLERGPLLRVTRYEVQPDDHILSIVMHHIISDAWSFGVLARELASAYNARRRGEEADLPELPVQFADYAVWQRGWLKGETLENELAYWRRELANAAPLELPADFPRPEAQTFRGALESAELDRTLLARLRETSQRAGATLSMTLLAAFFVLMQRYSGQDDIVVGVPIANRHQLETEGLIGAFVNTLALRAHPDGDLTFREFLQSVRANSLNAYGHQDMPFAKLVAELNPPRRLNQAPLVQVMFNHINVPIPEVGFDGLTAAFVDVDRGAAQFDLTLTVTDVPQLKLLRAEYNRDVFARETITRLLAHYETLLRSIAANPDARLKELPLLSEAERAQIVVEWNDTTREIPNEAIHCLFERLAARTPNAAAIRHNGVALTYAEVNRRANQLAHSLQRHGAAREQYIAVCMERSPELVIAQLAILKTGAAYVGMDPVDPTERLEFILRDTAAGVVLTTREMETRLANSNGRVIVLEGGGEAFERECADNLDTLVSLDDAGYVIYTSGSTGQPKGVIGLQRGMVNRTAWLQNEFPFGQDEVCGLKTAPGFVDAVAETFAPLVYGVPLVIIDRATVQDPQAFVEMLAREKITRLTLVPSLLRVLLETQTELARRLPKLRLWISSGEVLTPELVRSFYEQLPDRTLLNLYGATEASGDSTWHDTRGNSDPAFVPIGKPIANTQTYILDTHLEPVPVGVTGELYIGGAGVARGYLDQPALSREKFIPAPATLSPQSAVLYRTGDLASYLPDGTIHYRGRADSQVKLRGMRVELGEIESALRRASNVKECAVIAAPDETSGARLIAYYAPQERGRGAQNEGESLRARLQKSLPPHMVPSVYVGLDALPLTSSGKVDRRALALRPVEPTRRERANGQPRDELERTLTKIWEGALETTPIGIHDDFFELGGHSLLAVRMFGEIQQTLGRTPPITALFRAPTIAALASELRGGEVGAAWTPLAQIQTGGTGTPLFCVHGLGGGVIGYVPLARHLGETQPFYGLQSFGIEAGQTPDATIEAMAERYIEALRRVYPAGPYQIGGYSYGGTVAFEMAQQLRAQGREVALLAMFDQPAPNAEYWRVKPNARFVKGFVRNFPTWWNDYARLEARERWGRVRRKMGLRGRAARAKPGTAQFDLRQYVDDVDAVPEERVELMRAQLAAFTRYQPRFYEGRVTVFRAPRHPLWSSYDPALGWRSLAREVEVHLIAGAHRNVLQEPHVRVLAEELRACLAPQLIV